MSGLAGFRGAVAFCTFLLEGDFGGGLIGHGFVGIIQSVQIHILINQHRMKPQTAGSW
jgi:hypothetical protein